MRQKTMNYAILYADNFFEICTEIWDIKCFFLLKKENNK